MAEVDEELEKEIVEAFPEEEEDDDFEDEQLTLEKLNDRINDLYRQLTLLEKDLNNRLVKPVDTISNSIGILSDAIASITEAGDS